MKRRISVVLAFLMIVLPLTAAYAADTHAVITGKPSGIAVTEDGKLLVTDVWDMAVWQLDGNAAKKLTNDGARDLLGKVIGGRTNGAIASASFQTPFAIASYRGGYAVSDTDNNMIRFISGDIEQVSTLAGSVHAGMTNGKSTAARFNHPTGLAADKDGNLYIADTGNNVIRKLDKDGNVSAFAGGSEGCAVGSLSETRFNMPTGLCWYDGKLYVADSGNHRIVMIENGRSSVLAGGVKNPDDEEEVNGGSYRNGSTRAAGFSNPQGVLANEQGVYVADTGNGAVRKIWDGLVTTLTTALSPCGMAYSGSVLYVCDTYANAVLTVKDEQQMPEYSDIGSGSPWYGAAVEMYRHGIFVGTGDNLFSPDGVMTRAQYIKALSNMHVFLFPDAVISGDSEPFSDVPEDAYYSDALYWGRAAGATDGTGANMFSPGLEITRETVAASLFKYAKIAGYDVSCDAGEFEAFSDSAQTSGWADEAMAWAVSTGIFEQEPDGRLNPRGLASRGWTAQMFVNFIYLQTIK